MLVKCVAVYLVYLVDDHFHEYPRYNYEFMGHRTEDFDYKDFNQFPIVDNQNIVSSVKGLYEIDKVYTVEAPR